MVLSRTALRCMAFLTGINDPRPTRTRIANALKRSERTIKRAIAELVEIGWITCPGGGHGTASIISLINAVDWKMARDSKVARDSPVLARDSPEMARDSGAYKSVGVKKNSYIASGMMRMPVEKEYTPRPVFHYSGPRGEYPEVQRLEEWARAHGYRTETGGDLLRALDAMEKAS